MLATFIANLNSLSSCISTYLVKNEAPTWVIWYLGKYLDTHSLDSLNKKTPRARHIHRKPQTSAFLYHPPPALPLVFAHEPRDTILLDAAGEGLAEVARVGPGLEAHLLADGALEAGAPAEAGEAGDDAVARRGVHERRALAHVVVDGGQLHGLAQQADGALGAQVLVPDDGLGDRLGLRLRRRFRRGQR